MVACIPCAIAAPSIGTSIATFFGIGATAVAAKRVINKKEKKTKKKRKKKSQKGGTIKKDERKIHNDNRKCQSKCYKERSTKFKIPFGTSYNDWFKTLSSEEKKKYKELQRKSNKCSKTCKDTEKRKMRKHKLKYSKEYKVINKALKENCCKCHYVKTGKTLRRVKGPYSHCSYDMDNCCKDKKTIVKSKK